MSNEPENPLHTLFVETLNGALERGLVFPLYMAAVARNGSTIVARFPAAGQEAEFLAEHIEGQGLDLPIKMMVTDTSAQALLVVMDAEGGIQHLH